MSALQLSLWALPPAHRPNRQATLACMDRSPRRSHDTPTGPQPRLALAAHVRACGACCGPWAVLAGEPLDLVTHDGRLVERVCTACDELARRLAWRRLLTRERVRRWRERNRARTCNAAADESVTGVDVLRPARIGSGADWLGGQFRERREIDVSQVPPLPPAQMHDGRLVGPTKARNQASERVCANDECGRSLNVGRYKTQGPLCAQCRKAEERKQREALPWYATPEEVARQLEDEAPLPDDPYSQAWAAKKGGRHG